MNQNEVSSAIQISFVKPMSGKIFILKLWPKMLSANHFARFLAQ